MVHPSRSIKDLVIMLVAALLSTIAVCTFSFTLRVTFAAVVASSSSLSTRLASLSATFLLCDLRTACCISARYCDNKCAACPTVSPLDKFWRYLATLNSVRDSIGAGIILVFLFSPLITVRFIGLLYVLALY